MQEKKLMSNDKQKDKMIQNILTKLKKSEAIDKIGEKSNVIWIQKKE